MTDRRQTIVEHLDLSRPGLEIGPLDKPLVAKSDAPVLYVDHAPTAELRAKYAGDPAVGEIAEVDVVWGDGGLAAALGDRAPVAWVIASHVVEHAPDLVGWLGELAAVLGPGGLVSLAVPDKRFCFDHKRRTSDISDVVAAHLEGRRRPTGAAVYDFWARYAQVDAGRVWAGADLGLGPDDDALGLAKAGQALGSPDYTDVHCWTFTPASMVEVLERLWRLDLLPWFEVVDWRPTEPGSLEFYVCLRRLPDDLPAEDRRERQLRSLPDGADRWPGPAPAAPAPANGPPVLTTVLSPKERQMVEAKRRLMAAARSWRRRSAGRGEG